MTDRAKNRIDGIKTQDLSILSQPPYPLCHGCKNNKRRVRQYQIKKNPLGKEFCWICPSKKSKYLNVSFRRQRKLQKTMKF